MTYLTQMLLQCKVLQKYYSAEQMSYRNLLKLKLWLYRFWSESIRNLITEVISLILHFSFSRFFFNRIFFFLQIFGNSVTDVAISNGILIVMYSMGLVRLYNFQAISEQVT